MNNEDPQQRNLQNLASAPKYEPSIKTTDAREQPIATKNDAQV